MTDADVHPRRPSLGGTRPTVADSAFVSNQSYLVGDVTVGEDALVGMQSAVLRGATVESNCIVAAGAVVLQGRTVPEGHLAHGTPVETRPLGDDQIAQIEDHCRHYVERARQYKAEGNFE